MKYSMIIMFSMYVYSVPLVMITNNELDKSKHFLYVEKDIVEPYLIEYAKLVKGRYILLKKTPWFSKNIADIISLNARIIDEE